MDCVCVCVIICLILLNSGSPLLKKPLKKENFINLEFKMLIWKLSHLVKSEFAEDTFVCVRTPVVWVGR